MQASRVQFVFDDEALEVLVKSKESENKFVGGQNRWKFDSFTNWEFWWKDFPVLVYFKVRSLSCPRHQCFTWTLDAPELCSMQYSSMLWHSLAILDTTL